MRSASHDPRQPHCRGGPGLASSLPERTPFRKIAWVGKLHTDRAGTKSYRIQVSICHPPTDGLCVNPKDVCGLGDRDPLFFPRPSQITHRADICAEESFKSLPEMMSVISATYEVRATKKCNSSKRGARGHRQMRAAFHCALLDSEAHARITSERGWSLTLRRPDYGFRLSRNVPFCLG